ncbi:MAG: hypothetical protein ACR2RL_17725, partial [Gammaproteobacteria bacterium]
MNALRTVDSVLEHVLGESATTAVPDLEALAAMPIVEVRRQLAARGVDPEVELHALVVAAIDGTGGDWDGVSELGVDQVRAELLAAGVDAHAYLKSARALIDRHLAQGRPDGAPRSTGSARPGASNVRHSGNLGRWRAARRQRLVGRIVAGVAVMFVAGSILLERYDAEHSPPGTLSARGPGEVTPEVAPSFIGPATDGPATMELAQPNQAPWDQAPQNTGPQDSVNVPAWPRVRELTEPRADEPHVDSTPPAAGVAEAEVSPPMPERFQRLQPSQSPRGGAASTAEPPPAVRSRGISDTRAAEIAPSISAPPTAERREPLVPKPAEVLSGAPADAEHQRDAAPAGGAPAATRQEGVPSEIVSAGASDQDEQALPERPEMAAARVPAVQRRVDSGIRGRVGDSLRRSLARHLPPSETQLALALLRTEID